MILFAEYLDIKYCQEQINFELPSIMLNWPVAPITSRLNHLVNFTQCDNAPIAEHCYARRILLLWSPYVIGQTIIFSCCGYFYLLLFSSPNLSGRKLDVYHTSTHGVALAEI